MASRISAGIMLAAAIGIGCEIQPRASVEQFLREQRLQTVAAMVIDPGRMFRTTAYDLVQREAANEQGIDVLLATAVRIKESFDNSDLVSATGAVGLMQLMPTSSGTMYITDNYHNYLRARQQKNRTWNGKKHRTWASLYQADLETLRDTTPLDELVKVDQRFDPQWNIREGTRHLAADLDHFSRKYPDATDENVVRMALGAYYTGRGRISWTPAKGTRIPSDTKPYVDDVLCVLERLNQGLPPR